MVELGYEAGSCLTQTSEGKRPACQVTLKYRDELWFRVIKAAHLSRPEDYLSIYQSGCNHSCLKCHSWSFSQIKSGKWMSTKDIAELALKYNESVTVWEPRDRAVMWTATDLCHHCGLCIQGDRGLLCPGKLKPEQIVWSPQGWGPARNIVAFTGGDICCRPEFYCEAARRIKAETDLWVLIETNGFGLVKENLEEFWSAGVDSWWLDIKAYDENVYRRLCGTTNRWILEAPRLLKDYGFTFEVLTLYIPGWVELDQISKIAELVAEVDPDIYFTVLAFFPEYKLLDVRPPNLQEMIQAYIACRKMGLRRVKLGNIGVFCKTSSQIDFLMKLLGREAIG